MQSDLERIEVLENLVNELVASLQWYVDEDDTNEGDEPLEAGPNIRKGETWNQINEPWLAGKRRAMTAITKASSLVSVQEDPVIPFSP